MSVLEQLLDEYGVPHVVTGQNTSSDYVNIICEDVGCCTGDAKFKRGLHRSMTRSYCWAGGNQVSIYELVASLGIPWSIWEPLMKEEAENWGVNNIKAPKVITPIEELKSIMIPGEELHPMHRQYLEGRGFDPDFLIKEFGIKGILHKGGYYTGTEFEKEDWKLQYRVIIPIFYKGQAISYLGRSYLQDIDNRYLCAIPEIESMHHKSSLFHIDKATKRKAIVVEGTLDCMKLVQASRNFNVVATYGTSVKDEQLQMLRSRFDEIFILFDPEDKAQETAMMVKNYMETYGKKARNIKLKGDVDPGDLDEETAKYLVEALLGENNG